MPAPNFTETAASGAPVKGSANVSVGLHPLAMRTIFKPGVWTMEELEDGVQNVLMLGINNPAPPAEDIEIPGRNLPAQAL